MNLHDLIVNELENTKSLSALVFLIERGRELEFSICSKEYFISRCHSRKFVSLWDKENEQSFDSVEELIEKAVIGEKPFIYAWKEANIETIF